MVLIASVRCDRIRTGRRNTSRRPVLSVRRTAEYSQMLAKVTAVRGRGRVWDWCGAVRLVKKSEDMRWLISCWNICCDVLHKHVKPRRAG
jgi:hypothetical protein